MATFAHITNSIVFDPQINETLADYRKRFHPDLLEEWSSHTFKQIPDGIVHSARDNGDGTYTNPPPPQDEE